MIHLTIITAETSCIVSKLLAVNDNGGEGIHRSDDTASDILAGGDLASCFPREADLFFFAKEHGRWFLHGMEHADCAAGASLVGAFSRCLPLDDISRALRRFADRYEWALVPWADDRLLRAFAFITSDERLHAIFANAPGSVLDWPAPTASITASYTVAGTAPVGFKSVVLDEYVQGEAAVGRTIWKACGCDRIQPYVVAGETDDLRHMPGGRLELIDSALIRDRIAGSSIHRVLDSQSFTSFCREALFFDDPEFRVVPGDTDIDDLCARITPAQDNPLENGSFALPGAYSAAHDAPSYLAFADWWYALDVGYEGGAFSFFAARNPERTAAVAEAAVSILGGPEAIVGFY